MLGWMIVFATLALSGTGWALSGDGSFTVLAWSMSALFAILFFLSVLTRALRGQAG